MFDILHALSRDLEFLERRFVRLLNELMQADNSSVDDRAIEHARNSLYCLNPKFEQPSAHRTGVGMPKSGPKRLHCFRIAQKPRKQPGWKSEYFGLNTIGVKGDVPEHRRSIAYSLFIECILVC